MSDVNQQGNCSKCGGVHFGTGPICVFSEDYKPSRPWPQLACNHNVLKLSIVGTTQFYKCDTCRQNFAKPEPLTIKVSYPEPRAEDRQ